MPLAGPTLEAFLLTVWFPLNAALEADGRAQALTKAGRATSCCCLALQVVALRDTHWACILPSKPTDAKFMMQQVRIEW